MRPSRSAALVALCLLALAPLWAQGNSVYVTLCHAPFVVTDARGRMVGDLTPHDVVVFDNDRPQEITDFTRHVHAPLNLAVVIDRSGSVADRFRLVGEAATAFVMSVMHDRDDRGLLAAFDSKVYLLQDWTADPGQLVANIRQLSPAGGTSVFDALFKTCRDKFDPTDPRQNVVVLITDGEDTASVATFDQALQMASRSHVAVYVVGVRAQGSLNTRDLQGHRVLSRLADLTGGRLIYPDEHHANDLAPAFAAVEDELRNGYDVSYALNLPPDNTFHRVRIETRDRALTVHTRPGYYAQRPPA